MRKRTSVFIILFFLGAFLRAAGAQEQEALTWGDCLAEARQNNPDLISAVESVKEKKADKGITASGLYPQISADMAGSTAKTSTATTSATADSYSYGLSGSQLIFDGLSALNDIKAASENVKAAQENYRYTSSTVRYGLRSAFISLLKAQELIHVAGDIVKIRRDNLELITLRYQSGLEHKGALLTAGANIAEANFELAQAKRDVELTQRKLSSGMGRKEFKPVSVKGDFNLREPAGQEPNFENLAMAHPSVLKAAAMKNSALFGVRSAYGDFTPQLSGSAAANKKSAKWPPEHEQWSLGLTLSVPIFEGGLKSAQLFKAQAVYNQAQEDERGTRDTVITGLEEAWVNLQDSVEKIQVRQKSLEATEQRSIIAEAQYSTGFITFDNWIIIENDLVEAKKAYLQAQADALLSEAGWVQAKGETLEYE
jgi:TolC family type I secretion outer membrane protein